MRRWRLFLFVSVGLLGLALPGYSQETEPPEDVPWKFHLEFSFVKTSGNSDTQSLAGKAGVKREGPVNRIYLVGTGFREKKDGEESANRWLANGRWERVIHERLFAFLTGTYTADKFSGYRYRFFGGPGLGYEIVKTEAHELKALASVNYTYNRFSNGPRDDEKYWAGNPALHYAWQILENLRFRQDLDYLLSFKDTDTYFLNSETGLEVKVNKTVSLGVSYRVSYQSRPPFEDVEQTDQTFFTSLIIDF